MVILRSLHTIHRPVALMWAGILDLLCRRLGVREPSPKKPICRRLALSLAAVPASHKRVRVPEHPLIHEPRLGVVRPHLTRSFSCEIPFP